MPHLALATYEMDNSLVNATPEIDEPPHANLEPLPSTTIIVRRRRRIAPYSAEDPYIYERLFKLNVVATVFQFATATLVMFLTVPEQRVSIYSVFPVIKDGYERGDGNPFGLPTPAEIMAFNPAYLSGFSLFLTAINHLLVCTIFRRRYEADLERGLNVFRWVEYAFSASCMRVMIAIFSGMLDFQSLSMVFVLTMLTMLLGLAFEVENSRNLERAPKDGDVPAINWLCYWLGFIPHCWCWLMIFYSFFRGVAAYDAPPFVWCLAFIIFFLDMTFAINLGCQWLGLGKFQNYVYGEYAFIILSFTSKQLLCWMSQSPVGGFPQGLVDGQHTLT